MKKVLTLLMVITLIFGCFSVPVTSEENIYKEFFVDVENGSDLANGSKNNPFKTIEKAKSVVRAYTAHMTGDIVVNIASGRYELSDSIEFENIDSGCNGYKVIYRGDAENKPVLSGGKLITGFTECENGIWKAYADFRFIRDLFVNGVMADIAKSENKIFGTGHYNPVKNSDGKVISADGIYINKADLGLYENPSDIEFKWDFAHADALVHVKDLRQDPQNINQVIAEFSNPFWNSVFNRNTTYSSAPGAPGWEIAFSVRNAYELLDEPGEFYYNKAEKTLYYMPRDGEDMTCAEVICPTIDKLVGVSGRGPTNLMSNISFENLKFAHTTWSDLDENSVYYNQAEAPMVSFAPGEMSPGAVEASWVTGLCVKGCDFYGLATIGLKLFEGVTDAVVEGNTFADIGCGALTVGYKIHTKYDEPVASSAEANVLFRKGWTTGHQPNAMLRRPYFINSSLTNEEYYSSYVWTNTDELAENPNAKSYIKADLGKPYNISTIMIGFSDVKTNIDGVSYAHTYTPEEKNNFEVLVSNDRYFNTYKTVQTYTTNTNTVLRIPEKFSEKYRYVMIRKTKAEPFAMTYLRVYSRDEDFVGSRESGLCKNINIRNNYITRVAQLHTGSPGITAYYTQNVVIDHNVITQVPYSGLSLGWGWDDVYSTPKDNTISNNYISSYMLQSNDGGGIYVLGTNPNTKIFGNYIKDGKNGYGSIYTDGGSVGYDISNNVVDNGNATVFMAGNTIKNITGKNNYGATADAEPFSGTVNKGEDGYSIYKVIENNGDNCTVDEGISILPNDYPKEAAEIAFNAGLTDEYKHIMNNVPQKDDVYYDGVYAYYSKGRKSEMRYADYTNYYKRIFYYDGYLSNIYKNGVFGDEPWQYPVSLKYQIQELHERTNKMFNEKVKPTQDVSGWFRGGHIDELYMYEYLVNNVVRGVEHLSYEEMVEICNERLSNSEEGYSFGKYKVGAKSELQEALNNANSMASNTEADKYLKVRCLERALNTFEANKYSSDIVYAYLPQGKTYIDKDNKTVTITLPKKVTFSSPEVLFTTVGDTTVTYSGPLKKDVPIPLTIENYDVYGPNTEWTLIVKNEDFSNETDNISAYCENWYNSNDNAYFKDRGGKLVFQPWVYPYMYKTPLTGEIKFSLKADRADNQNGISLIFSSASGADIEYDGKGYVKNTYYMLKLMNQTLKVYLVLSGNPKEVASVNNVGFKYGEYNDLKILNETIDGNDYLTMSIGDNKVFDKADIGRLGCDGYFGILTKSVKVELTVKDDKQWEVTLNKDINTIDVFANVSDKDKNTLLFVAFYDDNNRLINITSEEVTKNLYTYDVPKDATRVAVFQTDGFSNMSPIRQKSELQINK